MGPETVSHFVHWVVEQLMIVLLTSLLHYISQLCVLTLTDIFLNVKKPENVVKLCINCIGSPQIEWFNLLRASFTSSLFTLLFILFTRDKRSNPAARLRRTYETRVGEQAVGVVLPQAAGYGVNLRLTAADEVCQPWPENKEGTNYRR